MKNFIKSIAGIKTIITIVLLLLAIILGCTVGAGSCIATIIIAVSLWLDNILSLFVKEK